MNKKYKMPGFLKSIDEKCFINALDRKIMISSFETGKKCFTTQTSRFDMSKNGLHSSSMSVCSDLMFLSTRMNADAVFLSHYRCLLRQNDLFVLRYFNFRNITPLRREWRLWRAFWQLSQVVTHNPIRLRPRRSTSDINYVKSTNCKTDKWKSSKWRHR